MAKQRAKQSIHPLRMTEALEVINEAAGLFAQTAQAMWPEEGC